MASIDKFNDHSWKDVIPAADLELYAGWRRETFVGPRPALLARPAIPFRLPASRSSC
jgi:maleamate amidohydrolase